MCGQGGSILQLNVLCTLADLYASINPEISFSVEGTYQVRDLRQDLSSLLSMFKSHGLQPSLQQQHPFHWHPPPKKNNQTNKNSWYYSGGGAARIQGWSHYLNIYMGTLSLVVSKIRPWLPPELHLLPATELILHQGFSTFEIGCITSHGPSIWSTTGSNWWWRHCQLILGLDAKYDAI